MHVASVIRGRNVLLFFTSNTGGPRYVREIGTPNICSIIMNLHIKIPTITVN